MEALGLLLDAYCELITLGEPSFARPAKLLLFAGVGVGGAIGFLRTGTIEGGLVVGGFVAVPFAVALIGC